VRPSSFSSQSARAHLRWAVAQPPEAAVDASPGGLGACLCARHWCAGVEFAGTLNDFVFSDIQRKYPELTPLARVTLLQSQQSILTQFDAKLQQVARDNFMRSGVKVRTGVRWGLAP
jgi:hypothetical protein